jgi:hypothetical protein
MTTSAFPLRLARSTNSTATSFTAKIPVAVEPSGAGVHDLMSADMGYGRGTYTPKYIEIIPFATDGDNDTFSMRLYGWTKVYATALWIPRVIADLAVVVGSISGTAIAANTVMADTITVTKGPAAGAFQDLINTANDTPASIILHTRGCDILEFDFDLAGAQEGVSMNAYWRLLDDC